MLLQEFVGGGNGCKTISGAAAEEAFKRLKGSFVSCYFL